MVELLDDLFARAAAANEPDEMNFIRKHARALQDKGVTAGATARLFSNPAGDPGLAHRLVAVHFIIPLAWSVWPYTCP
mgnify:CR=1 FL=1